jgi:hypothetical protein
MDPLKDVYEAQPGFWNFIIALLVFGGMARLAFWRDRFGMRVAAPLVVGLGLLPDSASSSRFLSSPGPERTVGGSRRSVPGPRWSSSRRSSS